MRTIIVCACEGNTEKYLIDYLLDNDLLQFKKEMVLDESPMVIRQIKTKAHQINLLPLDTEIIILRIGDTLNEKFDLDCLSLRNVKVYKICTKPEIEILGIIAKNQFKKFNSQKEFQPKEFFKNISNGKDFNKFIQTKDIKSIALEYKNLKKHKKDNIFYTISLNSLIVLNVASQH